MHQLAIRYATSTGRIVSQRQKMTIFLTYHFRSCDVLLNQTLSYVMALQLALGTLTWCFTLLYILIIGLDVTAMMGLLIMMNMTSEMLGYCLFCTELTNTATTISQQIYVFQWEKHSPAVQKMVAMIIARGQAPLQIKACGFIPINLELFAKVSSSGSSSITDHIMYRNIYENPVL